MDLTLYQKIVGVSTSTPNAYVNDTITHVNGMFNQSPSFKKIKIDGVEKDCILSHTKKANVLDLLFRPKSVLNRGIYVTVDADTYLITEFVPNEIYPKAVVELCNESLKWKDALGNVLEHKCVIKARTFTEIEERQVMIGQEELIVLVQYNRDTKTIIPTQRFILGDQTYEMLTIDDVTQIYNGVGIMQCTVKLSSTADSDDVVNKIADDSGNSNWGGW